MLLRYIRYFRIVIYAIECTSPGSSTVPPYRVCLKLINHPLTDGRRLLHVAVEFQSDPELIRLLLECGCDPAFRSV